MLAIEIDVPTLPEREELLKALEARGLSPRPVDADDHLGIEIPCSDVERACTEVMADLEAWIAETGLPLVPLKAAGHVYLRPPGS